MYPIVVADSVTIWLFFSFVKYDAVKIAHITFSRSLTFDVATPFSIIVKFHFIEQLSSNEYISFIGENLTNTHKHTGTVNNIREI